MGVWVSRCLIGIVRVCSVLRYDVCACVCVLEPDARSGGGIWLSDGGHGSCTGQDVAFISVDGCAQDPLWPPV